MVSALCIVGWRVLGQIPVVDVTGQFINNRLVLYSHPGFFAAIGQNSVPFSAFSIGTEGIGPYIVAVIVMSLMAAISERIRTMSREPAGRLRIARWTRGVAILLALGQAYGFTVLYQNTYPPAFGPLDWSNRLGICLTLAGGTAMMILLADLLDEHGLGFGYGAFLFYALGPVGVEVHRIADFLNVQPSPLILRPLALWIGLTVVATVGAIAILLAARRITLAPAKARRKPLPVQLRLVPSGVLRPPPFAFAVLFLPTFVANYYVAAYPTWAGDFLANWGPDGPNVRISALYVLIEAFLIVGFAMFTVAYEYRIVTLPSEVLRHITRLGLLGGVFLALLVVGTQEADFLIARSMGDRLAVSGFDVLVVVAVLLITIRALEGRRMVVPYTASPSGIP